jgi:hypothetical protein
VVAGLATVPFEAARSAATLDVTPPHRLPTAMSLGQATQSLALVLGWAAGGTLLATIGARGSLVVNACSFVVSAALLLRLPPLRPAPEPAMSAGSTTSGRRTLASAARAVASEPTVRKAALLAIVAVGPVTAVDALVVPFVASTWSGQVSIAAGILAGGAAADLLLTVAVSQNRPPEQLLRIAACCCAVPAALAVAMFSVPTPAVAAGGFIVGSLSLTTIAPASASLAPRLPTHLRASCFTVLATALTLVQVALTTAAGFAADSLGTTTVARSLMLLPLVAGAITLTRRRATAGHPLQHEPSRALTESLIAVSAADS